jgi:hypothetical protein
VARKSSGPVLSRYKSHHQKMEAIRRAFGMDTLKQDLDRLKEQTGNLDGAIEELKASVKRIHAASH